MSSQSGQFTVSGLPMGAAPVETSATSQVAYIRVDPALLAVSCERIKQALLNELGAKDEWRGSVSVLVRPVQHFDESIDVVSVHHRNSWSYRLEMPDQVDRKRLFKAVVQVLLQEMANRRAKSRGAELPLWLVEGMTAHLQPTSLATLTLEPETWIIQQRERYADPLRQIREILRARPPLSFNELSWPAEEQLAGAQEEVYRASAQFFVFELVRLKNGRAQLGEFVRILPESLNWQTAFLRAFESQFERLLNVDKWWALGIAQLTSRDMTVTWNYEESYRQLEEALAVTVQVRLNAQELPMNTQVKLQHVLAEWPMHRQTPVLLQKNNVLQALRIRAPQELIGLVDNYRIVVDTLLNARQRHKEGPFGSHLLSKDKGLVQDAIKRLNELDAQRENLRPLTNTRPAQLSSAPPSNGNPIDPAQDKK